MNDDGIPQTARAEHTALPVTPPFIWPDNRVHAGLARYAEVPPGWDLLADADLISAVIVGAGDETVAWVHDLLAAPGKRHISLVLVLVPAGPTRAEHLEAISEFRAAQDGSEVVVDVRLLPMAHRLDGDCQRVTVPPTVIQGCSTKTGRTVMSIGSVGDVGHDPVLPGSLNFMFQPDDGLRDAWRLWFQYVFSSAAPLTPETSAIPHLVPAKGDPEAALMWEAFRRACAASESTSGAAPTVDPDTGEVIEDANGEETVPWDGGRTALDPLARCFQQAYASGWLVTVDEGTRLKPLAIPVKATLLGQQSERNVGALKQKQSFTLQVLDDAASKAIEKCRKVTDVMELLTCPLSQGNRWLPDTAKALLENELVERNKKGRDALCAALGGAGVTPEAAEAVIKGLLASGSDNVRSVLREKLAGRANTPETAQPIVEELLKPGNEEVAVAVGDALGAETVRRHIRSRSESIRKDLNEMYRQLGQGSAVPDDKLRAVLDEVEQRLTEALGKRITPRAVYNRIGPPDLTAAAPDENWNQPLALLARSAQALRQMLTDPYRQRQFAGLAFTQDDFVKACNVFGDSMAASHDMRRAGIELQMIDEIMDSDKPAKDKCHEMWRLIKGERPKPER